MIYESYVYTIIQSYVYDMICGKPKLFNGYLYTQSYVYTII